MMGIRHYTYKDIPSATRAKASSEAQKQLQSILTNPVATPEQRAQVRRQQAIVRDWVAGTLRTKAAEPAGGDGTPASEPEPAEHNVVLEESVEVADNPSSAPSPDDVDGQQ